MTTPVRTPTSDVAIRIDGNPPPPDTVRVGYRVALGAGLGAAIGTTLAILHGADASMFVVEIEFLATGFAMIGALFALIGATPALQGWGEESARG